MYVCTTFVVNKRIHIIPYHFLVRGLHLFLLTIFTTKTRNPFCGSWYLPHSQVHNDRTVPIITVMLHIIHCACTIRPYFYFRFKIWRQHCVYLPRFPTQCELSTIRVHLRH